MSKKKQINYYIPKEDILSTGNSNIIKWYEYKIKSQEEMASNQSIDDSDINSENSMNESYSDNTNEDFSDENVEIYGPDEEEIDLANSGLNDDEQALVADILARFSEAKSIQGNVDNVINQYGDTNEVNSNETPSEEDLVSSICAPKQNNVDDLIKMARGEL